jgi:hypothetical protein
MPSFGGEVKESVPCPSFAACKRTSRFMWITGSEAKFPFIVPSFASWGAAVVRRTAHLEMNEGTPSGSGYKKPKWLKCQRTPPATFTFTFYVWYVSFFQIQLDHFVPMLVKNVSNTCSAITYYINRLTHCKKVTTSNPAAQLTELMSSYFAVTWY